MGSTSLVSLREDVQGSLFAAGGVMNLLQNVDGTAAREGMRRMLHATIGPVSDIALVELRRKLDAPTLKLNFSRLRAADIQGRSRAYAGMVGAGLAPDKAAEIAGLAED